MRVAVLISGEPRFCKEFEIFIDRLKEYSRVDWFFYLWKNNRPHTYFGDGLISPNWRNFNYEWAEKKIRENLPENHYIGGLELADQDTVEVLVPTVNWAQINLWKEYYTLKMADRMRQEKEKDLGEYDLVIRARPDISVDNDINLSNIKQFLDANPDRVMLDARPDIWNTMICICSSKHATYLTSLSDLMPQHVLNHGRPLQAETLVHYHLVTVGGLKYAPGNFNLGFRHLGRGDARQHKDETDWSKVSGPRERYYVSDFGKWY